MDNQIFNHIKNSVFKVITADGTGSGFYIKDKNIILTNAHVVSGFRDVAIETSQRERIKCKVLVVNPGKDIAILEPQRNFLTTGLVLSSAVSPEIQERLSVVGFPLGLPCSVTEGIVSSNQHHIRGVNYIQTDAAINPGNSGGPVFNQNGEVVGIATCKFSEAENIGFALPVSYIFNELTQFDAQQSKDFGVRCHSCSSLHTNTTENCLECGVELDISNYFQNKQPSLLASFIESALKLSLIDPVEARMGKEFWEFYKGSALIRIFIYKGEYLYATCPVADLPTQNLSNLFEDLLSRSIKPYSLGLAQNTIYLSYRRHISDCDNSKFTHQIQNEIAGLINKADELDNFYIEKFNCVPTIYTKSDELKKVS